MLGRQLRSGISKTNESQAGMVQAALFERPTLQLASQRVILYHVIRSCMFVLHWLRLWQSIAVVNRLSRASFDNGCD